MGADLGRLAGGDDRRDRDEATVPRRQFLPLPDFAEQDVVGEVAEPRRDVMTDGERYVGVLPEPQLPWRSALRWLWMQRFSSP
ncbi:hypothetical protein J2W42_001121 [Rhizobium tibeticum]|nr:hypothetical protein [Rhizobium tibeticum]